MTDTTQDSTTTLLLFVGINNYACGEYLFVCTSLDTAKYLMKERYGEVEVLWNADEEKYDVVNGKYVVGRIIQETVRL